MIGLSAIEHPVTLQFGGSEPEKFAQAARIGGCDCLRREQTQG
jgi:tRNA-dihydrouridine synthase